MGRKLHYVFSKQEKNSKGILQKGKKRSTLLIIGEIQTVSDHCTPTRMAKVNSQTTVKHWLHWGLSSAAGDLAHEFRQLDIIRYTAKIEHSPSSEDIVTPWDVHQETHKECL